MRKTTHTAGTKSYARWAEDLRQKDPEKKHPHRAKVYLATHKDKTNDRDEHVAELENLIDDQPELAENEKGRVAWKGDALHKVLGEEKPGQVHGMGLLPVPKQVYGWTSHHLKNINITTADDPSSEVDMHIIDKMEKLEEHNKKQDQLIQELLNNKTCSCHGSGEKSQVNFQTTECCNFQQHSIHSKRKRVECNFTNQNQLLTEHEETLRLQKNKKQKQQLDATNKRQDQVTQNKIPTGVTSKKTCPSAIPVGTTILLNSINKVNLAFATLMSCDPDAQVGGLKLGNQFWKVRVDYPLEENEELIRPWGQYKTLGDAKGKTIAWPSVYVGSFLLKSISLIHMP